MGLLVDAKTRLRNDLVFYHRHWLHGGPSQKESGWMTARTSSQLRTSRRHLDHLDALHPSDRRVRDVNANKQEWDSDEEDRKRQAQPDQQDCQHPCQHDRRMIGG